MGVRPAPAGRGCLNLPLPSHLELGVDRMKFALVMTVDGSVCLLGESLFWGKLRVASRLRKGCIWVARHPM